MLAETLEVVAAVEISDGVELGVFDPSEVEIGHAVARGAIASSNSSRRARFVGSRSLTPSSENAASRQPTALGIGSLVIGAVGVSRSAGVKHLMAGLPAPTPRGSNLTMPNRWVSGHCRSTWTR